MCNGIFHNIRRKKDEKVRKMIDRLSNEQRAKVASLIQKHSQEMLLLIAERLTLCEDRVSSDSEGSSPTADLSRPPVTPPEFKRSQLFKSPKEFEKIDDHVFQIVQREYSTFTELVKDLIVVCETDLDKARAIFRWVTWTDLNELEVEDSVCPDSPLGLLRGIKYGTETYHDLCRRLCRNSWTAVSIDGSWYFINCNWGARHVKAENQDGSGGLADDGVRGGVPDGGGTGGTFRKKKREGLRMDSNTHTHYNHVEILYEPPVPNPEDGYGTLGGASARDVSRRNSLEARESSGVPQILPPEEHRGVGDDGRLPADGCSCGGGHCYSTCNKSLAVVGHDGADARYPSRLPLGQTSNDLTSSGSYTFGMFSGECGPLRPSVDSGVALSEDCCMRAKLRGLATPVNTSSTANSNIIGSNNGNTVLGIYKKDVSAYASPNHQHGTYDPALDNAELNRRTHYVRKLLPCSPGVDPTGSNKENAGLGGDRGKDIILGGGVLTLDGFAGRCLLDAFYQKDPKSSSRMGVGMPPAGTRLSDGDTASYSSGYSKSSAESSSGISPSQSPFASVSSTPRSGGALSAHSDSSSASCCSAHRDRDMPPSSASLSYQSSCCDNRVSPPLPFFRPPSSSFSRIHQQQQGLYHHHEGYLSSDPNHHHEEVNVLAAPASFRNSSSSENSSRCSPPPPSVFRTGPYGSSKTSPPSSLFRFTTGPNGTASSVTTTAIVTSTLNGPSEDTLGRRGGDRLSPSHAEQYRWRHSDSSSGGVSAGRSERRDSVSTVGESLIGDDASARPCRPLPLFYQCDEFYFITDPEDHIYQHFPDDPAWQLLEVPLSMAEFLDLPVVKSPFFNNGLKFASHYDCKQHTNRGDVTLQLKIARLLTFGCTLVPREKRLGGSNSQFPAATLDGRVMVRIIGHKAIFTVAPPKRGRYYFTVYVKDGSGESVGLLQSACAFQITFREGREAVKAPYPKIPFFGPTLSMSAHGLLPQTHIDPLVAYNHDDINFQFAAARTARLSYSLTFYCQSAEPVEADLQRYAFLRHRDDVSLALQVRCPHIGRYVFSIYGAEPDGLMSGVYGTGAAGQYACLYRYLIDCRQSATNKTPLPRACHRWCHSQLLEPVQGDLAISSRVSFRVRAPLVCDMALLMGDAWYHFRCHGDHVWEATLTTSPTPCSAKLYARLNKDTARFSPFLEFQIVDKP
ncbi:kyphoscoliosis peptidase [Elysia marginata]|uniref:Kyphoscoliosis peptidase n=1 Tax=Elysia marginata TaxID=1093978 RepID=A0AAV4FPJ5_9GAST|nr:kyphoscoliosis peptidase [Elysia marginata]